MSDGLIKVAIQEEYGYQDWVAYLTPAEWDDLVRRWKTMRGLNCLVPVRLIIPQAKLVDWSAPEHEYIQDVNIHELVKQGAKRCHIHEEDDSYLEGVDYEIPNTWSDYVPDEWKGAFYLDGVAYREEDLEPHREAEREYCKVEYDRMRVEYDQREENRRKLEEAGQ